MTPPRHNDEADERVRAAVRRQRLLEAVRLLAAFATLLVVFAAAGYAVQEWLPGLPFGLLWALAGSCLTLAYLAARIVADQIEDAGYRADERRRNFR